MDGNTCGHRSRCKGFRSMSTATNKGQDVETSASRSVGLGALLRDRRRDKHAEPMEVHHHVGVQGNRGIYSVVEGTADVLLSAGVCGPEHLPEGRKRIRFGMIPAGPYQTWTASRHAGGRVRLYVTHREAEHAADFVVRYRDAERALAVEESGTAPEHHRACLLLNLKFARQFLTAGASGSDGLSLDRPSAQRLSQLSGQVLALLEKMEAVTEAANVQVDKVARDRYRSQLKAAMAVPMPTLTGKEGGAA